MQLSTLTTTEFNGQISTSNSNGDSSSLALHVATLDYVSGGQEESAVFVDLSYSSQQSVNLSNGEKALASLKASAAEAAAYPKKAAKDKLTLAIEQLQLIRLLAGPNRAKDLVGIAKQIRDAAQEYAGAEEDLAGQSGDLTADVASSGAAESSAVPAAATDPATSVSSLQQPQDPFYVAAETALGAIKKELKKVLPGLLASPDRQIRDYAKKLREEFNQAVNDTLVASANYSAAEPLALETEENAGIADSSDGAAAASDTSAPSSLNLVV